MIIGIELVAHVKLPPYIRNYVSKTATKFNFNNLKTRCSMNETKQGHFFKQIVEEQINSKKNYN